ncbi:MAG: hypothetical protein ACTSRA_18285 [Promethearchaeota archaeon]
MQYFNVGVCSICSSTRGQIVSLNSEKGKALIAYLESFENKGLGEIIHGQHDKKGLYIFKCLDCGNHEIRDRNTGTVLHTFKIIEKGGVNIQVIKRIIVTSIISFTCSVVSLLIILATDIYLVPDIAILTHATSFNAGHILTAFAVAALYLGFCFGLTFGLLYLVTKKIYLLAFTFRFHRLYFGIENLYFFEYFMKDIKVNFKASISRAILGTILILGIGIMSIENFLTIPHLKPLFPLASLVTLITIATLIPIIIVTLFISPLVTSELNLYWFNKKDRTVENVGEWLDSNLKFFAVIDVILTTIIIIDSNLNVSWLVLMASLVLLVFSLFLVFTVIFNQLYHGRINEKFRQHLSTKYMLPIRKVYLPNRIIHCRRCGNLLNYIEEDKCSNCNLEIPKCIICGDVLAVFPYDDSWNDNRKKENNRIYKLAKILEEELDESEYETEVDEAVIRCPNCGALAHVDEFYSWIRLNKKCPNCNERIYL